MGIDKDGDNRVCLYPTGDHSPVSNLTSGGDAFVIDALQDLLPVWRPCAVLKVCTMSSLYNAVKRFVTCMCSTHY
ncbi:hypothetical protein EON63_21075 [archaeon]|nr:MAG: hypothetical protein EON63_21075 [archaeon]